MEAALVHLDPTQKARLARRARKRGRSFSQEVRNAVDLYLALPVESEEDLARLAADARRATEAMISDLDRTIAALHRSRRRRPRKRG
jgi:hypothetical protein